MSADLSGSLDATPPALRLAWWATAWLRGLAVTDLVLDAVIAGDATHTFSGLDGSAPAAPAITLTEGLARLRALGCTSVGATFPAEGDPVGLGGPPPFNAAALESGSAVIAESLVLGAESGVVGAESSLSGAESSVFGAESSVSGVGSRTPVSTRIGLVPSRVGAVIIWQAYPAARRQLPDVGEADRGLRKALVETAQSLAALDVARWRPEVADELMNLRHPPVLHAAPGVPARCVDLAARGVQAAAIVDLALDDDGASVSAAEIAARRDALVNLDRAARRALTGAGSPEAWPPA